MTTYRIALSIYTRSPAAYKALKSWGFFELPSQSSLNQFRTTLLQGRCVYYDFLNDQYKRYTLFQKECEQKGRKKPLGEGVLILDEVKVIGKIAWNSKNVKNSGVVMEEGAYTSLADIFTDLKKEDDIPETAEYFLQFLLKDVSSAFDVIGPHCSSASTMDSTHTHICLLDAMDAFQAYEFKVVAIVMDGASSILTMMKLMTGSGKGAYGLNHAGDDPHALKPWFDNPNYPGELIHMIMCPTHQMKNLINQLWASRQSGARNFVTGDGKSNFGWKLIVDLWERESSRRDNNQVRLVPV